MTIIAAIKDADCIHYGSDSRVTYGSGPAYDLEGKWITLPSKSSATGIHMGCAGSTRLDNIIVSSAKNLETCLTPFRIADALKRAVISDSWREAKGEDGEPQDYSVDIILIMDEEIYRIGGDFSVVHIPAFMMVAVGTGEPYALGASHACRTRACKEQLKMSIQAAIKYDPNCGGKVFLSSVSL